MPAGLAGGTFLSILPTIDTLLSRHESSCGRLGYPYNPLFSTPQLVPHATVVLLVVTARGPLSFCYRFVQRDFFEQYVKIVYHKG